MDFSDHSQRTAIYCISFILCNKQDHLQSNMGFRWVLLKLLLKVLHNIKYNYITTASFRKRLWMSDLYVPNIICFQTQRWFWMIYVHVISCTQKPLCVHARHHARNLSSPVEHILGSEERTKSKRAGLWESLSGIAVENLTIWVRSFEIERTIIEFCRSVSFTSRSISFTRT